MVSDLQGYFEGIIMGLDHPRGLFAGENDGLGSRPNQLQLVSAIHLDPGSLLGNSDMLLSELVRDP